MKIVIVPSGFKECMDAEDVGVAMERGVKRFDPSIDLEVIPMIDGGEGFAKTIVDIKGGKLIYKKVTVMLSSLCLILLSKKNIVEKRI
jgi:glycerate 2-kinase